MGAQGWVLGCTELVSVCTELVQGCKELGVDAKSWVRMQRAGCEVAQTLMLSVRVPRALRLLGWGSWSAPGTAQEV